VFNLVRKRYLFLLISLAVIVPGTISLLVPGLGLNVGIDFAGGATIHLRPSSFVSITQARNLLKPLNLTELQVITGDNTSLPGKQTVWVRLNVRIDTFVQNTIKSALQTKYGSQLDPTFDDLTLGGKTVTVVTITKFAPNDIPKISDIQSLLKTLPNTTNVTATATPTVSPTPTAKATATPGKGTPTPTRTPVATATPKPTSTPKTGKGTPVATPTATATVTANPNPNANIKVKWIEVTQGSTTETITLLTRSVVGQDQLHNIEATLFNENHLYAQLLDTASVEPSVAQETTRNAIIAVIAASVLILLYIWFSFRKVVRPWRYGVCAIIALLHDVLVVLGVFSILGWISILGWTPHTQVTALFITALLTVVGFSVHDTIVVFDRIRENMQRRTSETFEQVVNASLVQTMARSLNTSLTVLFTLSALTLFGGASIHDFTLALLVGIFSGTYSSIFNASMLLVIWEKGELGFGRFNRDRTPDGREVRELARSRG